MDYDVLRDFLMPFCGWRVPAGVGNSGVVRGANAFAVAGWLLALVWKHMSAFRSVNGDFGSKSLSVSTSALPRNFRTGLV